MKAAALNFQKLNQLKPTTPGFLSAKLTPTFENEEYNYWE